MGINKWVQLRLANLWTDITPSVRGPGKVTIVHGKANEQSAFTPARCSLIINNADGTYSDVNQNSSLFGQIGPYTEMRVLTQQYLDSFTRTVANGMGTGDSGQTYTVTGTAANFDITGASFTLVTSTTSQAATTGLFGDVQIKAKMNASANTNMGLTKRMANGDRISAYLDLAGNMVNVSRITDGVSYASSDFTRHAMTLDPATDYWMLLSISEQIKVKVWTGTAANEPDTWMISCWVDAAASATGSSEDGKAARNLEQQQGEVGMFAQALAGSQTVTFDDFSAVEVRFDGEIPAWPPTWDNTGKDAFVTLEASGVTRRLNAKNTPAVSPLFRSLNGRIFGPKNAAYWSLEDTKASVRYRNSVKGGKDILTIGNMNPASYSALACTDPIPQATRNASGFRGQIQNSVINMASDIHLKFIYVVPEAGLPATTDICTLWVDSPNVDRWVIRYSNTNGGSLETFAYNNINLLIGSTGATSYGPEGINGKALAVKLDLDDDGTGFNTDVRLGVTMLDENQDYQIYSTIDNVTSAKAGIPVEVLILTDIDGAIGHISCGNWDSNSTALDNPHLFFISMPYDRGFAAYQDEQTVARFIRLCLEEGVWGQASSDYDILSPVCNRMGQQPRGALIGLLQDCETVEHGILYELRDTRGYGFRTNVSLWNRLPTATFDYTAKPYSGNLLPTNDDQFFKNSIVVTGPGNSRSQLFQVTTGRKSVTAISEAYGEYPINFYPPSYADNHAQWLLRFLSWDEQRIPNVKVELHRDYFQTNAGQLIAASNLGIGRNMKMTNNPKWLRGTLSELVTGYTEVIGNLTREITYNCVPYGPYKVAVYLATDTLLGLRNVWVDASVNTAINSSATTLSVKKTASIFETGTDAKFPYYIIVDSEVMRVTAITGGTSPQSFTVDRGQRDTVAKAHLVNAPVLPYDFPVIGLAKRLT